MPSLLLAATLGIGTADSSIVVQDNPQFFEAIAKGDFSSSIQFKADPAIQQWIKLMTSEYRLSLMTDGMTDAEFATAAKKSKLSLEELPTALKALEEAGVLAKRNDRYIFLGPSYSHSDEPYADFIKHSQLDQLSTEQSLPSTAKLSQEMHKDQIAGLKTLFSADSALFTGLEIFNRSFMTDLTANIADKVSQGGRVFIVGSGTSGRIAIDLGAKWSAAAMEHNPALSHSVLGLIAGGDSVIIRAKENFEDSVPSGRTALEKHSLNAHDIVILLSASGSAKFNIGAGEEALAKGANVYYFFNSEWVPDRTADLIRKGVSPIQIDIGPSAIAGSTRLTVASFAEMALGASLSSAFAKINSLQIQPPQKLLNSIIDGLHKADKEIENALEDIAKMVSLENSILAGGNGVDKGYITYLTVGRNREAFIDTTEIPPTFSTQPPVRNSETGKRRPEYHAFLVDRSGDVLESWKYLLGRSTPDDEKDDVLQFSLNLIGTGPGTYSERAKGQGNLVVGIVKTSSPESFQNQLCDELNSLKAQGAKIGLIVIQDSDKINPLLSSLSSQCDACVILNGIPQDPFGLVSTVALKQTLNLISNGAMIQRDKVFGNQMVDVVPSNNKLIDRSMRLAKSITAYYQPDLHLSDETIYHYLLYVKSLRNQMLEQGIYVPSAVKITLAMMIRGIPFEQAVDFLKQNNESLERIYRI